MPVLRKYSTLYAIAMDIFKVFKQKKDTGIKEKISQANALLYPDKIIIETIDRVKEGFGISSTKITILAFDTASNLLGLKVKQQLSLTEENLSIPKDYKKHYADFLKLAGFKNGKEHHKNALLLNLHQKGDTIIISPTINEGFTGKNKGFLPVKGFEIIIAADVQNKTLGDQIKYGWTKCECNCI